MMIDLSRLDLIGVSSHTSTSNIESSLHSPPRAQSADHQNEDKLSALPDHILLDILERLHLDAAIQASTLSRRWARLPRLLSRLLIDVAYFLPRDRSCHWSVAQVMATYTFAVRSFLPSSPPSNNDATIKHLQLSFYLMDPYLHTIGRAVGNVVQSGNTDCLEFTIYVDVRHSGYDRCVLYGQRFMSFFQECHAAFRWLTKLILENLTFGHTDIHNHNLIDTCTKLQLLSMKYCDALIHPVTGDIAILTIDAPYSSLLTLEITACGYAKIDLLHVPKLRRLDCVNWICANPPLRFGNVPWLDTLVLRCPALNWQTPFTLSYCLSNISTLSTLYLNFCDQMIWIEPEGPKHLSPKFLNLKDVYLYNIFYDCDLSWTMFILEAAPSLNNFYLVLSCHPCERGRFDDVADKVNMLWDGASPGFKHHRLNLLQMAGFTMDEKLIKYIRLVMERAVGLKRIRLLDQYPCSKCEAIYNGQPPSPERSRFPIEEREKRLIRQQLLDGFSSAVEIRIG